jgi:hypothetical protein
VASSYYATSNDGKTWSQNNCAPLVDRVSAIVYANNTLVATGYKENSTPHYNIARSTDNGTSWSGQETLGYYGFCLAYGAGTWVAGSNSTAFIKYSTNNGVSWNNIAANGGFTYSVNGVAYGKDGSGAGLWVAVGQGGNNIATSSNGTSFTMINAYSIIGNCVAYGKDDTGAGLWVTGGSGMVYSSNGSSSWTAVPSGSTGGLTQVNGVAYGVNDLGAGLWVAVGAGGNKIAYSSNGSSWTSSTVTNGFTTGYGVACGTDNTGKTLWVAVGAGGNKIATSPNGISWTGQTATAYNPTIILGVMFKPP